MPTNLPVRRRREGANGRPGADLHALFLFYVGFGLVVLLIVTAEIKLGVFENPATLDMVLQSTGTDVATDEAYGTRTAWGLLGSGQADNKAETLRR